MRDWLIYWLTELYHPRIEGKVRMPVGQPFLDTNYKHLEHNTHVNLDKNDSDYNGHNYGNHNDTEEEIT